MQSIEGILRRGVDKKMPNDNWVPVDNTMSMWLMRIVGLWKFTHGQDSSADHWSVAYEYYHDNGSRGSPNQYGKPPTISQRLRPVCGIVRDRAALSAQSVQQPDRTTTGLIVKRILNESSFIQFVIHFC